MENSALTKLTLQNQTHRKRYTGLPRRKWREQDTGLPRGKWREQDTGLPRGRWREQDHLKVNEFHRTGLKALNLQRSFMIMILTSRN